MSRKNPVQRKYWGIQISLPGIKEFLRSKTYSPSPRNLNLIKRIASGDNVVFYFTGNNIDGCPKKKVAYVAVVDKINLKELTGKATKIFFNRIKPVNGLSYQEIVLFKKKKKFKKTVPFGKLGFNIAEICSFDFKLLTKNIDKPN